MIRKSLAYQKSNLHSSTLLIIPLHNIFAIQMALKKREFTPESGNVDTYAIVNNSSQSLLPDKYNLYGRSLLELIGKHLTTVFLQTVKYVHLFTQVKKVKTTS